MHGAHHPMFSIEHQHEHVSLLHSGVLFQLLATLFPGR